MDYTDAKWQNNMKIKVDYNNMREAFVGKGYGVSDKELSAEKETVNSA